MKRIVALLLAALLLLPALPQNAHGADRKALMTLAQQVSKEAVESFEDSCISADRLSFHGFCGLMVSHQMYNLGINKYLTVNDGNKQFDYYCQRKKTTGGYSITPYYGELFTLREALDAVSDNGKRSVRNVLVGFEWTSTSAGAEYGHTVFINGIVDGMVYFVESFDCAIGGKLHLEGQLICVSIETFANYFDNWTQFDGLIHFGNGTFEEVCPRKDTAVYVQARFDSVLRSQPCVVGDWKCKEIRTVDAGERLFATAVYEGDRGLYYRVQTDEGSGFISASAVSLLQTDEEDLRLEGLQISSQLVQGSDVTLSGTVISRTENLSAVEVSVTNRVGIRAAYAVVPCDGDETQLEVLKPSLQLEKLPAGWYTVEIYGEGNYAAAQGEDAVDRFEKVLLSRQLLQIKSASSGRQSRFMPELMQEALAPVGWIRQEGKWVFQEEVQPRDGWFRQEGKWYFYENGQPKTGWVLDMGARYYLDENGAAVTGWQMVGTDLRYFTREGAMVTDRVMTNGKRQYQLDQFGVAQFLGEVKKKK